MRIFGEITGVSAGETFDSRQTLHDKGVHLPLQAGISGAALEGADSIVLSGGYADDEDYGDEIIYTGMGGRDESSGLQVSDQQLSGGNKALVLSFENEYPIRVVRGWQNHSEFAPATGYRYDGLYKITNYWQETVRNGLVIWRFKLKKIETDYFPQSGDAITPRVSYTQERLVRDYKSASLVKELYHYRCQVCEFSIVTPIGYYSEAAHIQPLGKPHNGVDNISNMLCLCPNHHKMLDYHAFTIMDNLSLTGITGVLKVEGKHSVNRACLAYHRKFIYGLS